MITTMLAHRGNYAPTVLAGRMRLRDHWPFDRPHGWYQLVLVEDGIHVLELPTGTRRCQAGAVYLLRPDLALPRGDSPRSRAIQLAFTVMACPLDVEEGKQRLSPESEHRQPDPLEIWDVDLPTVLDRKLCERVAPLLRGISTIWWQGDREHLSANRRLAGLLDLVVDHYTGSAHRRADPDRHWLVSVLPEIEEQLPSLKTVADLAALTGLSTAHLHREFSRVTGETPGAYLRRRRLERAADMLRETDYRVATIAEMLGYSSQAAFNNAWRQAQPVAPSHWRRLGR